MAVGQEPTQHAERAREGARSAPAAPLAELAVDGHCEACGCERFCDCLLPCARCAALAAEARRAVKLKSQL